MLPAAPDSWSRTEAAHLLARAGFGGSPAAIDAFHKLGRRAAVESLIHPKEPVDDFPLPAWAQEPLRSQELAERTQAFREMRRGEKDESMTPEQREMKKREVQQKFQRAERERVGEAQTWWLKRMLTSKAPLREKMTLFWHDHFATSMQKVKQPEFMVEQNDLFRRNALGDFHALTRSIARDPAMLLYLDSQNSKKGKPNENFAREVMELFTLGEGHYTENDIREAARAFTGMQLVRATGKVFQNRRQWDEGDKTFLGVTAKFDCDGVIDQIFAQPQAARYLPEKLWHFFVHENLPKPALDMLAKTFADSKFSVAAVLREIFLSKEFYSESAMGTRIKSPIEYLVMMCKQLEIANPPYEYLRAAELQLGQVLFMPPNVAGWDWGKAWINTNTLLSRYQVAGVMTGGSESPEADQGDRAAKRMERAAKTWDGPDYEKIAPRSERSDLNAMINALILRFFQGPQPGEVKKRFLAYAEEKRGVVFTNHEVGELIHLMMSTPHYQLM